VPFKSRISKEEIARLPIVSFSGEVIVVNDISMVADCVDYLSQQPSLGIDTETRPAFYAGKQFPTSLLQISSLTRCYLLQLNIIGLPQSVADLFSNPNILKVGLAFTDDLRGLRRLTPFEPQNCVDVQSIVNRYGILDLGLQKIFAIIFGQRISKTQRLTNWDNRQLTLLQQRYASTDAWATLCIYNALIKETPLSQGEVRQLVEADHQLQLQHQLERQQEKENQSSQPTD